MTARTLYDKLWDSDIVTDTAHNKDLLLSGLDETGVIMAQETPAIEAFERHQHQQMPWLHLSTKT